jgi:hypothetical protein
MTSKKPRFTDQYRYPTPYRHAQATDVRLTWAAEYKRLKEQAKQPPRDLREVFKQVSA